MKKNILMIKVIHFLGEVLINLAEILKAIANLLRFFFIVGICLGIFMFTLLATFEAFHFIQPTDYVPEFGRQLDIFKTDLWAWIVAGLGWVTILYGLNKMFIADKQDRNRDKGLMTRESNTWLE